MVSTKKRRLQERIIRNSGLDPETGCWPWLGRLNNQGYPVLSERMEGYENPVTLFAHRVSCEVFGRPPRRGEEAAHAVECPLKHCVAPAHVRWATRLENEADKRHPTRLRLREVHPPVHALEMAD